MYEPTGVTLPRPWARLTKWVRRQPWRAAAAGLARPGIADRGWQNGRGMPTRVRITAEGFLHDVRSMPMADLPRKDRPDGPVSRLDQPPTSLALVRESWRQGAPDANCPGALAERTKVGR